MAVVEKAIADTEELRRAAQHAILTTVDSMNQLCHLASDYPAVKTVLRRNTRELAQIKLAAELLLSSLEADHDA
jgi:hypothetical protein